MMVFAEGKKTESIYLKHWHQIFRGKMLLTIAEHVGSAPKTVVRHAADVRKAHLSEEKKKRGKAYDEYWCVLDVDEHNSLPDALQCAADNDINVALSNPCLELWFLIHFHKQTAYIHRDDAQKEAYKHLNCTKSSFSASSMRKLVSLYDGARSHAMSLDIKHSKDGTAPPCNPSSNIWQLVDIIKNGRP